jgi:2-polyprenyl-3-methyl-5-hydroxy-6-metoxy-1,4-benzoquinol methylase
MSSVAFWTEHQVGGPYVTLRESFDALANRALLYPSLTELMPTSFPGKTILDYGCGPGHDTILFCQNNAGHVFYYDISPLALGIVDDRLDMHGLADRASPVERLSDAPTVDHIHCAGVLHHTENPDEILRGFWHCLKPGGEARIMIYDGDRSTVSQSEVPITLWWTEAQFTELCADAGFNAEYVGGYDCSAPWRPDCMAACYRLTQC